MTNEEVLQGDIRRLTELTRLLAAARETGERYRAWTEELTRKLQESPRKFQPCSCRLESIEWSRSWRLI